MLGKLTAATEHDHQLELLTTSAAGSMEFDPQAWQDWLARRKASGWKLIESEWHHSTFDPGSDPPSSVVAIALHVANEHSGVRYIVRGDLNVKWSTDLGPNDNPIAKRIDARQMHMIPHRGRALFQEAASFPLEGRYARGTLIAHDMDNDGLSELLLPTSNVVFWNRGGWVFEKGKLLDHPPPGRIGTAVLGDFTGDGRADLVAACLRDDLLLYTADSNRRFSTPPLLTAEGGIIPEEYQAEYVADRVHTASTVFMGISMQCARCHDHKFDPFTQRDFYRFAAYFNNIRDSIVSYGSARMADPVLRVLMMSTDMKATQPGTSPQLPIIVAPML